MVESPPLADGSYEKVLWWGKALQVPVVGGKVSGVCRLRVRNQGDTVPGVGGRVVRAASVPVVDVSILTSELPSPLSLMAKVSETNPPGK